jgi:serine/threonine-protein kinase
MIATDGTARLLDFGIAKATMAAHVTRQGMFKGKLAYSAPEQIRGNATQQSDIYSLSVVLWELLVGHRLHNSAQSEGELIAEVMTGSLAKVTDVLAPEREWLGENRWKQLEALDPIIQRGLTVDMAKRWPTAAAMEAALTTAVQPASSTGVAGWLKTLGREFLSGRDRVIALEEASWRRTAERVPRRMSQGGLLITEPGTTAAAPPAIARHRTRLLAGAGIGAFVLILAFIVWITRDPGVDMPAAAATLPVAKTQPTVAPTPVVPAPTAPPAADTDTAAAVPIVSPSNASGSALGEATAAKMAPPVRAPVNPTRNRVVIRPKQIQREPAPQKTAPPPPQQKAAVATTPTPAAEPAKPDCNPPYYYDGSKKVFKPACL